MIKTIEVVDVRPIEPKYRSETIVGTCRSYGVGEAMERVVDHDPTCM